MAQGGHMKIGGLEEAKEYMMEKDIPQLFESMMTALMYQKPDDHIKFLEECLERVKIEEKVRWHTFIDPLPEIPKTNGRIKSESDRCFNAANETTLYHSRDFVKNETPLPPIGAHKKTDISNYVAESQNDANALTEKVFNSHIMSNVKKNEDLWYSQYIERKLDTSCLEGKPVIFVLGGPGSGKGTQCAKIVEKFGFCHLSAGDLLRGEVAKGSDIGLKIDSIMREGQLVPQDVTICLLKEAMVDNSFTSGFLIDGFPREIRQGKQFEKEVCQAKMVLNYDCPDDVLVSRLLARAQHSGRTDDNEETIKKRLELFHSKTQPVIEHYANIVFTIRANQSIENVFKSTCKAIMKQLLDGKDIQENDSKPPEKSAQEEGTSWYATYAEKKIDTSCLLGKPVIFVLGGPGSGKGTQCAKIVEKYGFCHLSAGDLLRGEVAKGSNIGLKIDSIMKEGQLVPQDVTICLLKEAMVENSSCRGFLIDGFPREIKQGKQFERQVCFANMVLNYDCPDDVLVSRLLARAKHSGRTYDNEETIKKRLELFHSKTQPVMQNYADIVVTIPANRDIEEVFGDTCRAIEKNISKKSEEKRPVVFIIGAPSTGKSTQCKILSEKFNLAHIVPTGKSAEEGSVIEQVKEAISSSIGVQGYLLDGFPITQEQGMQFEMEMCPVALVLLYTAKDDVLIKRMREKSDSESEEMLKSKLEEYHMKSTPMVLFYQEKTKTIQVDCSVEEIFKDSCSEIESILKATSSKETPEAEIHQTVVNNQPSTDENSASELGNQQMTEDDKLFVEKNFALTESEQLVADDHKEEEVIIPVEESTAGETGNTKHLLDLESTEIIFVIGGPGCGKGTQCRKIVEKYGHTHLSTGDMLRAEMEAGTERGKMLSEIMKTGELVPQNIIIEMLSEAILTHDNSKKLLIDGFPREVIQAEIFEEKIKKPNFVLYFACSSDVMLDRIKSRGESSGRVDDNEEILKKRVDTFEKLTLPVVEYYKQNHHIDEISAVGGIDEIFGHVCRVLDKVEEADMAEELAGKKIIFVLGGPGSGKGTQCAKIVEKYGFCHLSTGDLLRQEVQRESERAKHLKAIMAKGELVAQETILELLREAMIRNKDCNGYLIDGFPRDTPQGEQFEKTIAKCKYILYFECSNEVMVERLLNRAKTSGRVDDNEETIKKRLKTFENQTLPVLEVFNDRVKKVCKIFRSAV